MPPQSAGGAISDVECMSDDASRLACRWLILHLIWSHATTVARRRRQIFRQDARRAAAGLPAPGFIRRIFGDSAAAYLL